MDVGRSVCYTGNRGNLNEMLRHVVCDHRDKRTANALHLRAILVAVTLFTMCSGLAFKLPRLRKKYGA